MTNDLKNCPSELAFLNKSKLLRFVLKRKQFYSTITNEEVRDQNIFKDVYMKKRHKESYFELLKQRRVEIHYRNIHGKKTFVQTNESSSSEGE